ncbi:MAG: hypothetical protein Sapg2KO_23220 [Saprospiraceae bacterium]
MNLKQTHKLQTMKKKPHYCLILFLLLVLSQEVTLGQSVPLFQEENGLVVFEVESATNFGQWTPKTSIAGFSGEGYLLYEGPDLFNTPGQSKMTYQLQITTPGKYRFQWRSRIAIGDSNTEHNDSWLRFPDASDFYAEKGNIKLYPKGLGKTPNPEGSTKEGWFKVYQNVRNNWAWRASTNDNDPHNIYVEFDSAGIYTLEVAGRSNGHALDRIALYQSTVAESMATNLNTPTSVNLNPTSNSVELEVLPIQLSPNPANNYINIAIPKGFTGNSSRMILSDAAGRIFNTHSKTIELSGTKRIPISHLPPGVYWLQITNGQQLLRSKFIKK